jgi:hypothetical protein
MVENLPQRQPAFLHDRITLEPILIISLCRHRPRAKSQTKPACIKQQLAMLRTASMKNAMWRGGWHQWLT